MGVPKVERFNYKLTLIALPRILASERSNAMVKLAEKPVIRTARVAKPQPGMDREAIRAKINKQYSKTLEYLAR